MESTGLLKMWEKTMNNVKENKQNQSSSSVLLHVKNCLFIPFGNGIMRIHKKKFLMHGLIQR